MSKYHYLNELNKKILEIYREIQKNKRDLANMKDEARKNIENIGDTLTTTVAFKQKLYRQGEMVDSFCSKEYSYKLLDQEVRSIKNKIKSIQSELLKIERERKSSEAIVESNKLEYFIIIMIIYFIGYQVYGRIALFLIEGVSFANLPKFNLSYIISHPIILIVIPILILLVSILSNTESDTEATTEAKLKSELDELTNNLNILSPALNTLKEKYDEQILPYQAIIDTSYRKEKEIYNKLYQILNIPQEYQCESFVSFLFRNCDKPHLYETMDEYMIEYKRECRRNAEWDAEQEMRRRQREAREREREIREQQEEQEKESFWESLQSHNKRIATLKGRRYGDFEENDGYLEENFGSNGVGFGGSRRRIVERDINGKWVKDEYGQIHVKNEPYDTD